MPARLLRKTGTDRGEYPLTGETTIGRHPDNTITVGRDAVSGKHARIRFDPVRGCYLLEDLGSRNGTRLDGERIQDAETLGHLHVITFADTDFIFQDLQLTALRQGRQLHAPMAGTARHTDRAPTSTSGRYTPAEQIPESERTLFDVGPPMLPPIVPPILAGGPISDPIPAGNPASEDEREKTEFEALPMALPSGLATDKAPPIAAASAQSPNEAEAAQEPVPVQAAQDPGPAPFFLVLTDSDQPSRRFRLYFGDNLIGRGNEAGIQLESLNLSRRHATLTIGDGVLHLRDEGSRNHTYVNDVQIEDTVEIPLSSRLRFGAVEGWLLPIAEPSA